MIDSKNNASHGVAIPLIIIISFVRAVNPNYKLDKLKDATLKLADFNDNFPNYMGFRNKESIDEAFV